MLLLVFGEILQVSIGVASFTRTQTNKGLILSQKPIIIMSREVKYSREFKLDALNLLQEGKSLSDISKSLGISANTSCTWRRRYKLYGDKAFQGPGIRLPRMSSKKSFEKSE